MVRCQVGDMLKIRSNSQVADIGNSSWKKARLDRFGVDASQHALVVRRANNGGAKPAG